MSLSWMARPGFRSSLSDVDSGVTALQFRAPLGEITNGATDADGRAVLKNTLPSTSKERRTLVKATGPQDAENAWISSEARCPPVKGHDASATHRTMGVTVELGSDSTLEYRHDVMKRMLQREYSRVSKPSNVAPWMRSRLIDWLVEVHEKFGFRRETFFLTVSLIDRYLSQALVPAQQLQLVGVSALLLAAKFEEVPVETKPPTVDELVYITAKAYTKSEVLDMEIIMLQVLFFEIACPTPATVLLHIIAEDEDLPSAACRGSTICALMVASPPTRTNMAWFLLELAMVDGVVAAYSPSTLAAAAWVLSAKLLGRRHTWPASGSLSEFVEAGGSALEACRDWLEEVFKASSSSSLQAVRLKYRHALRFPGCDHA